MQAYASGPPPARPRRPPDVVEALLEQVIAKQEATERLLKDLLESTATKEDFKAVYAEARATRKILDAHVASTIDERKAMNRKLDAILDLLGDVLSKLPPSHE